MARLIRLSGLLFGLLLPSSFAAAQEPGVRVDRTVLDALGPAPRDPLAAGGARAAREQRQGTPRRAQRARPEETKDGVFTVPPPQRLAAGPSPASPPPQAAEREAGAPRPLAPSLLPASRQPAPPTPLPQAASPQPVPAPAARPPAAPPPAPTPQAVAAPPRPQTAAPPAAQSPPATPQAVPPAAPAPIPPAPVAAGPVAVAAATSRAGAQTLRLGFSGSETELDPAARQRLLAFAAAVPDDEAVRITVTAYAGGDPADPSRARRTSLSRALAVRSALMEGGIRSTRIDVRALGLAAGDGPPDRVDVVAGGQR